MTAARTAGGAGCGCLVLAMAVVMAVPLLLVGGARADRGTHAGDGPDAADGGAVVVAADGTCVFSPAVGAHQRPALAYVPACGYPDPYTAPPGQCTSWAAWNWPGHHGAGVTWGGDAWEWLGNAAAQHYPTSSTPAVGAIAVFDRTQGAGAFGHVAVVVALDADGSGFTVSEMNVRGAFVVDRRHVNAADPDLRGFVLVPIDALV